MERPRIEYLGAIHSEEDLGRRPGFFERMKTALLGKDPDSLVRPIAVARNRAGMLVVTDPSIPMVHFFDLEGRRYHRLGEKVASQLESPVGIAIDDAGVAYVADSARGRVFVFGPDRELIAELGERDLLRPTGLALGPDQESLYVVDTVACQVVIFDLAGKKLGSFGSRGVGPGQFNSPTFIDVARDGAIIVSDSLNFRIQTFRPDGTFSASFGRPGDGTGHFTRPKGVTSDGEGRIYVVDAAFENIQIFDPDGRFMLPFGEPGTGPGEFILPAGIFLDSENLIWVADSYNQRVQVFRLLVQ